MKRIFIVLGVVLVVGIAGALIFHERTTVRMPVYKGMTARAWLRECSTTNANMAFEAFSHMDANALPFLVNTLRHGDSRADKLYQEIYPKLPGVCRQHLPAPMSEFERRNAAYIALFSNPYVRRVYPDLLEMLKDKNSGAHY